MNRISNCWVLGRSSGKIKDYFRLSDYDIKDDYLLNEKSTFSALTDFKAEKDDYILVKSLDSSGLLFFGVIDSFDDNLITACNLYNIGNFQIFANTLTGSNLFKDLETFLKYYLINDVNQKAGNIEVEYDKNTLVSYSYIPYEKPSATTLTDFLISIFKQTRVCWRFKNLKVNEDNSYTIVTEIYQDNEIYNVKNNIFRFLNWEVFVQEKGPQNENAIYFIDKASASMFSPKILDKYYLSNTGNLTNSTLDVSTPLKIKIYIVDLTEESEEPINYREIANSELTGNEYSHEISFDIVEENNFLSATDLKIGRLFNIYYDNQKFVSVLSGILKKSSSKYITLKFGNIRSNFQQVLKNL